MLKLIVKFLLFGLVFQQTILLSKSQHNIDQYAGCKNPDELDLEIMLFELESQLIENGNVENMKKKNFTKEINMRDKIECYLNNSSRTASEPLCPSKFEIINTTTEFPFSQKNVVCSCNRCKGLSTKNYGCRPTFESKMVLIRKECGQNGIFNWEPILKQVVISCNCFSKKFNS